jgi:hypothetical protein
MMTRIVIGAMARSGSTWAFNAARMLAEKLFPGIVYAADIQSYEPPPAGFIEVIKTHDISTDWQPADKLITCVRDIRDAFCSAVSAQLGEVESYNRRGLCDGVFTGIEALFVDPSLEWAQEATCAFRFESMMVNKVGTLRKLADYLFPDHSCFDSRAFEEMAIKLEILPELVTEYNPEQGYLYGKQRHRQHVGVGGYHQRLPYFDVQHLEEKYAAWFEHFGYAVGEEADALVEELNVT